MLMLDELTWPCHVCGDERPDARISVAKGIALIGPWPIEAGVNVRYCNDRAACSLGVQDLVARQVAVLQGSAARPS